MDRRYKVIQVGHRLLAKLLLLKEESDFIGTKVPADTIIISMHTASNLMSRDFKLYDYVHILLWSSEWDIIGECEEAPLLVEDIVDG